MLAGGFDPERARSPFYDVLAGDFDPERARSPLSASVPLPTRLFSSSTSDPIASSSLGERASSVDADGDLGGHPWQPTRPTAAHPSTAGDPSDNETYNPSSELLNALFGHIATPTEPVNSEDESAPPMTTDLPAVFQQVAALPAPTPQLPGPLVPTSPNRTAGQKRTRVPEPEAEDISSSRLARQLSYKSDGK